MTISALQKAQLDRSIVHSDIKRIKRKIDNFSEPWTESDIETFEKAVTKAEDALVDIQRRIVYQNPDDLQDEVNAYDTLCDELQDLTRRLNIEKAVLSSSSAASAATTLSCSPKRKTLQVKLPPIELPSFSGGYADWTSFADLFRHTIGDREDFSAAQRLQYLKSAVKGEASELIKSFTVTNDNFSLAWNTLEERYNHKREIVLALMRRLFAQPHLNKENPIAIQKMLDTTKECLRSLKNLSLPTEHWDMVIIFMIVERLDSEARKQWALKLSGTNLPSLHELYDFLDQHVRGLQASMPASSKPSQEKRSSPSHHVSTSNCPLCKDNHPIFKCSKMREANPEERSRIVKRYYLCFKCLSSEHKSFQCNSKSACKQCKNPDHNTLLCRSNTSSAAEATSHFTSFKERSTARRGTGVPLQFQSIHSGTKMILGTMMAGVRDVNGQIRQVRVLLDSASGCTMMTESCAKALGLRRQRSSIRVNGVGQAEAGTCKGEVTFSLLSNHNNFNIQVQALVFGHVTGSIPNMHINHKDWSHLAGLTLADPEYNVPGQIDILLDADYTEEIMLQGKRKGERFSPKAYNTQFGWVLCGRVKGKEENITVNHAHCELETIVQKFWELEKIPSEVHLTDEQRSCEESFVDTHYRDSDGRFVVQLPFNNKVSELGSSQQMAIRRFLQVERRLAKNPEVRKEYINFMREYEALGHMELIPPEQQQEVIGKTNYLPHHFVLKEESSTTKLRTVFDASAKTSTGLSLNDTLLVGATVQTDLFAILLKFRLYPIVVKADIAKMFRQFLVSEEHQEFQRIVWRESSNETLKHYRLKTVTYGTASAPFLATRCLQQLAFENEISYPLAAAVLKRSTYVDDSIPGATTVEEARRLIFELNTVCSSAGLQLRKFCSNDSSVLDSIPSELRETQTSFDLDRSGGIKALGVKWDIKTDTLLFAANLEECKHLTKRVMLSELAKMFDPLGLITPITVRGKMLFQQVWKIGKLTWESSVPPEIAREWNLYKNQLRDVGTCSIQRCIFPHHHAYHELHGFSDASENAYGAVIYLRHRTPAGEFDVRMITSKVRVAPLKRLSIERLELCGATLLAELMTIVKETFNFSCDWFAWTDSTIVLRYIAAHPSRWKTFVAHKVARIQKRISVENWRHVKGTENPADLLSRGVTASELVSSALWWQGPQWLRHEQLPLPQQLPAIPQSVKLEMKKQALLSAHIQIDEELLNKYSSFNKLKRVTAYVFRFINKCRRSSSEDSSLTPSELSYAQLYWIKQVQSVVFKCEINQLQKGRSVKPRSSISSLNPFVDADGILRVGGRLNKAQLQEEHKHPMIIPHSSHLTKSIIRDTHLKLFHAGVQLTSSVIQQQFWITRARSTIRQVIRCCVTCRRHKAENMQQLMGALPQARVTPSHPFQHAGVDYAGPFHLINMKGRKRQTFKGYFAIFVCLSTKAVHLEAVSDLTTDAFIAAFRRFVSRRGLCSAMYSDCGTNFVGTDRELQRLTSSQQHNQLIADGLASSGIKWNFNSPGSPHQGGLWEAGVKSVKHHLRRVVGETKLTFEEFQTVLCQIEAILNSRPLCRSTTDPNDPTPLTPGHFLVGRPLVSIPDEDVTSFQVNRLSRWQLCQQMTQRFWFRWKNEYLSSLQQRFKWKSKQDNVTVGDIVLVNDANLPPTKWKMGIIQETIKASDGCVRVAVVKTTTGTYQRAITKLTPILNNDIDN